MNELFKHKLLAEHPWLFRQRWRCGLVLDGRAGWFALIRRMAVLLDRVAAAEGRSFEQWPAIVDIKEKFGGLRVAGEHFSRRMHRITEAAEQRSLSTCEVCGARGEQRMERPWIRTLCETCDRRYWKGKGLFG